MILASSKKQLAEDEQIGGQWELLCGLCFARTTQSAACKHCTKERIAPLMLSHPPVVEEKWLKCPCALRKAQQQHPAVSHSSDVGTSLFYINRLPEIAHRHPQGYQFHIICISALSCMTYYYTRLQKGFFRAFWIALRVQITMTVLSIITVCNLWAQAQGLVATSEVKQNSEISASFTLEDKSQQLLHCSNTSTAD